MDLMNPTLTSSTKQQLTAYNFALGLQRKVFIGECGCVECDDCGGTCKPGMDKAGWFDDALTNMKSWTNLEAFCYSNVWGFRGGNYRIDTSPSRLPRSRLWRTTRISPSLDVRQGCIPRRERTDVRYGARPCGSDQFPGSCGRRKDQLFGGPHT
jgi:hypothetical protein